MQKIGIIYNPKAGSNKNHPERRENLKKILGDRGILRETSHKEELHSAVEEFHKLDIDIVAISGGDGTNQCVLTEFCEIYGIEQLPTILLLRGGTMNLLETSLKMKGTPEERLSSMVKLLDAGDYPIIPHTLLRVNNKFGFIFGNGLVANFMQQYYMGGDTGVKKICHLLAKFFGAVLTGGHYVTQLFEPIKATVRVGDTWLPQTEFTGILAATERECGLGFKPCYRAREQQGKLHFLAFNLQPVELFRNLPRLRLGRKIPNDSIFDVVTDKVVVQTNAPYTYTVDGEMLHSMQQIEISAGPIINVAAV